MSAGSVTLRTAAAIVGVAGLALPTAGCGGSGGGHVAQLGSTTAKSSTAGSPAPAREISWLAFSLCMRSHGVPKFPDPTSSGQLPKVSVQQLGVSSSEIQAAQAACSRVLPTGQSLRQQTDCLMVGNCPPAEVQLILEAERKYARCMRAHGVPNWPDPTVNPQGMPVFDVTAAGIDRQFIHSSLYRSPNAECQHLSGGAPVPRQ